MKKLFPLVLLILCVIAAQADLKTWLHGAPPSATPGPPDAKTATVSFAPDVVPDKPVKDFMQTFAEAMRVHDGAALKPRLSEKYSIPDLPSGHDACDLLMQAMVKIKAPNEMIVTSIEPDGDARVAKVDFKSEDRPTKTRTFRFDAAGKLLSADFFSLQVQQHGFF